MRAIVLEQFGGPEVLRVKDVAAPAPSRGEVRVRIRAAGVNRADLLQRMGMYPAPPGSPKDIPGLEIAGEIDALGEDVREWSIGDRVMGLVGGGAYAEHVTLHERMLAKIPEGMSFEDAAAIPEAFVTAYDALVVRGDLRAGDRALVHAVGSGVGSAGIQIVRALGAISIGTARTPEKIDRAKELGLDHGVVAKDGKFADDVMRIGAVDVVLELVGGPYVAEDLACVAPLARIVLVGLLSGTHVDLDLASVLRKRTTIVGTVLRSRPFEEKIEAALLLRKLVSLFEKKSLVPIVDAVFSLDRAGEAHERLAKNESFGKVILRI